MLEYSWEVDGNFLRADPPIPVTLPTVAKPNSNGHREAVLCYNYSQYPAETETPVLQWKIMGSCLVWAALPVSDFVYVNVDCPLTHMTETWKKNYERFLRAGISIRNKSEDPAKTFFFVGHTNSQTREGKCCFLIQSPSLQAASDRVSQHWKFKKGLVKRAKHSGILFTSCDNWATVLNASVTVEDDITRNGFTFTDGCGRISLQMMKNITASLRPKKSVVNLKSKGKTDGKARTIKVPKGSDSDAEIPSVVQVRAHGVKGVLTLDPTLEGTRVVFRKSMHKFNSVFSEPWTSHPPTACNLRIGIKSCSAPPQYQTTKIGEQELVQLNARNISVEAMRAKNLRRGPDGRLLIKSDKARRPLGVADYTGLLKAGQCFFQPTVNGKPKTLNCKVAVTRSPSYHPGDIRVLQAVPCPALSHLRDCIVFPVHGDRPHPDEMSGGDLDGDQFLVIWDQKLVPKDRLDAFDYDPSKMQTTVSNVQISHVSYFVQADNHLVARVNSVLMKLAAAPGYGPLSTESGRANMLFSLGVDNLSFPRKELEGLEKLASEVDVDRDHLLHVDVKRELEDVQEVAADVEEEDKEEDDVVFGNGLSSGEKPIIRIELSSEGRKLIKGDLRRRLMNAGKAKLKGVEKRLLEDVRLTYDKRSKCQRRMEDAFESIKDVLLDFRKADAYLRGIEQRWWTEHQRSPIFDPTAVESRDAAAVRRNLEGWINTSGGGYRAAVVSFAISHVAYLKRIDRLKEDLAYRAMCVLKWSLEEFDDFRRFGHVTPAEFVSRVSHEIDEFEDQLPIYIRKHEIISALDRNRVVLLVAATGSGKSTQVPQYILDHFPPVLRASKSDSAAKPKSKPTAPVRVTQPRRLAATRVAARVAQERHGTVGGEVGYHIGREEACTNKDANNPTKLEINTMGILMNQLSDARNALGSVKVICVDEAHERSLEADMGLALLKKALNILPDLKLLIMSAEFDASSMSEYFGGAPIIHVGGRTFPVDIRYETEGIMNDTRDVEGVVGKCVERVCAILKEEEEVFKIKPKVWEVKRGWGDVKVNVVDKIRGKKKGKGRKGAKEENVERPAVEVLSTVGEKVEHGGKSFAKDFPRLDSKEEDAETPVASAVRTSISGWQRKGVQSPMEEKFPALGWVDRSALAQVITEAVKTNGFENREIDRRAAGRRDLPPVPSRRSTASSHTLVEHDSDLEDLPPLTDMSPSADIEEIAGDLDELPPLVDGNDYSAPLTVVSEQSSDVASDDLPTLVDEDEDMSTEDQMHEFISEYLILLFEESGGLKGSTDQEISVMHATFYNVLCIAEEAKEAGIDDQGGDDFPMKTFIWYWMVYRHSQSLDLIRTLRRAAEAAVSEDLSPELWATIGKGFGDLESAHRKFAEELYWRISRGGKNGEMDGERYDWEMERIVAWVRLFGDGDVGDETLETANDRDVMRLAWKVYLRHGSLEKIWDLAIVQDEVQPDKSEKSSESPEPGIVEEVTVSDGLDQTSTTSAKHAPPTHPDILVFLSGTYDLMSACAELNRQCRELNITNIKAIPLSARSKPEDEKLATGPKPAHIARRVIFATNVAETSLTFATLGHVVDAGWEKVASFETNTQITELNTCPISKASAVQRAGRVGRTAPGICHRLYKEEEFDNFEPFKSGDADYGLTMLKVIALGENPWTFDWLRNPVIRSTLMLVEDLRMVSVEVNEDEGEILTLTRDGEMAVRMGLNPKEARALIEAHRLGISFEYMILIAMRRMQDSFSSVEKDVDKHHLAEESGASLTQLKIFRQWSSDASIVEWERLFGVSKGVLDRAKRDVNQLTRSFKAFMGALRSSESDPTMTDGRLAELVARADLSGYYMHLAKANESTRGPKNGFALLTDRRQAEVDKNDPIMVTSAMDLTIDWVVFVHARKGARTFLNFVDRIKPEWIQTEAPAKWLEKVKFQPDMKLSVGEGLEGMGQEVRKAVWGEIRTLKNGEKEWRYFGNHARVDFYAPEPQHLTGLMDGLRRIVDTIEQRHVEETISETWTDGGSITIKGGGQVVSYVVPKNGNDESQKKVQDPVSLHRVVLMGVRETATAMEVRDLLTAKYGKLVALPQPGGISEKNGSKVRTFFAEFADSEAAFSCASDLWKQTAWGVNAKWIGSASYNYDIELPSPLDHVKVYQAALNDSMAKLHGALTAVLVSWFDVNRRKKSSTYTLRPKFQKIKTDAIRSLYRTWFEEDGLFGTTEITLQNVGVMLSIKEGKWPDRWNRIEEGVHVHIDGYDYEGRARWNNKRDTQHTLPISTIRLYGVSVLRSKVQEQIEEDLANMRSDTVQEMFSYERRDFAKWRNRKLKGKTFAEIEQLMGVRIEVNVRDQIVTLEGRRKTVVEVKDMMRGEIKDIRREENLKETTDIHAAPEPPVENPCTMCGATCERWHQPALCGFHYVHQKCLRFYVIETARSARRMGKRVELKCPGLGCARLLVKKDLEDVFKWERHTMRRLLEDVLYATLDCREEEIDSDDEYGSNEHEECSTCGSCNEEYEDAKESQPWERGQIDDT